MSDYEVPLPRAESLWLAGGRGPLATRRLPGSVTVCEDGKGVVLDGRALLSLTHLGCVSDTEDGRVVYEGDLPVLMFGNARYVLEEVMEER